MEYYAFHIGDWKGATDHLSLEEEAIYLRLMNLYYDTEAPLSGDVAQIARRIRARDQVATVNDVLLEFFDPVNEGWQHNRIDGELAKFHDRVEKARAAGRASGRSRRNERPLNVRSSRVEPPNTQNPKPSTASDKQKRTTKPAVFIAPDLSEVIEHWRVEKLNGDPEEFHNHFENCDWRLSGGRGKKMKNWKLAASNWSKRQRIFDPQSGGHKNGKLQLPKNRDGWQQFAEIHGLPKARAGESFDAWEGRLRSEIERRANQ